MALRHNTTGPSSGHLVSKFDSFVLLSQCGPNMVGQPSSSPGESLSEAFDGSAAEPTWDRTGLASLLQPSINDKIPATAKRLAKN